MSIKVNIAETEIYIYISENNFGDGAPAYRVKKELATPQEAESLKLFPYYQCVLMMGMIRAEEITETMNKDALFEISREGFISNKEQIDSFRSMMKEIIQSEPDYRNREA